MKKAGSKLKEIAAATGCAISTIRVIWNKWKVLLTAKPHHSKQVTESKDKIALFYLPAYSPDLNPDEHTNADVKQGVGSKAPVKTYLTRGDRGTPADVEENIVQYFKDHAISYAALC